MAGHNKWFKVKRSKGAINAKRGRLSSTPRNEIAFDNNNDVINVYPNLISSAGLPGIPGGN
jgi:transcriptional/translational regulatory protein YebC/TACO1